MKKILLSVLTIAVVGAVGIAATRAFFSDTETSTGNTFTAGNIDLKIDNTSYVTGITGVLVASPNTSWELKDLTVEKFFNFTDLKPGDIGEDTISLHVNSNDAWVCAAARVTDNSDQSCTEPELANDPTCSDPGLGQGDLAGQVNFAFWGDDGDNVYEQGENIFLQGPISGIGQAGQIALADSTHNVWTTSGVVTGGQTKYIGKAWCFGTLTPAAVAQQADGTPLTRGTGFACNGSAVNNAAQTDKVVGDLQFYAEQSRNNGDFTCATDYTPTWPTEESVRPVINGVAGAGEWEGCTTINFAGDPSKGTACVIAYADYLYALYQINDPTDDRNGENSVGNDQLGLNINPDTEGPWGKPYGIILQTGTDPAAFTSPIVNPDDSSSGTTDGWESEWMNGDSQLLLSAGVQTSTPYYGGTDLRISEWRLPLSSIAGLASGGNLKVGGAVDIGDGNSYSYPSTLNWADPDGTFVSIPVN